MRVSLWLTLDIQKLDEKLHAHHKQNQDERLKITTQITDQLNKLRERYL